MPLRDHFRPPASKSASWEAVHGGWPMVIVQSLSPKLPAKYVAHPRVHLGAYAEIDVSTYQKSEAASYEVRIYDTERSQRLVAAIELVSPANKDRPEHRRAFVSKCVALLQKQVSVSIVDLVTIRTDNLYAEMLEVIGRSDPSLGQTPPAIYAVACRATKSQLKPGEPWQLQTWLHALEVGRPLPTLPLWLAADFSVPLELEETYEETCKALRIP
jgi:hypothetical protein